MQYPLQHTWTLYHDLYFDAMKRVIDVPTVETFWGVYNNIPKSSALCHKSNYRYIREGGSPLAEHDSNKDGGQWVIDVPARTDLDAVLLDLLLGVIGQTLDPTDSVVGVVVNVRNRGDRVALWTNRESSSELGKAIREVAGVRAGDIVFKRHCDADNNSTFTAKAFLTA